MVSTLLGTGKQREHKYMYWEFIERGGKQAVRVGDWKAVRQKVKKNPDGPVELYDLSKDLGETNNIAEKHPKIVGSMKMKEIIFQF